MSLVRYRPSPLAPIKTLGLSTLLPALKQTAGPPAPSSPSRPISVLLTQRGGIARRTDSETVLNRGPVSLLQRNPGTEKWSNQCRVSNSPCVTDRPPQRCPPGSAVRRV
ncbi:hypothetical protein PBY51_001136 [Eleginops maclovinus]|uniref:Uncharacterized protein n=1 Tax=Eleginops maclovinus TaxID=56733 RepID=A0AAN7XQV3_ELEMC|nr:hypothetical protein PBY51_001136 [Eleginops maclovinus]